MYDKIGIEKSYIRGTFRFLARKIKYYQAHENKLRSITIGSKFIGSNEWKKINENENNVYLLVKVKINSNY